MLKAAQLPMHKAYVLCQAQSGLSVSDILRVSFGDVAKQLEEDVDIIHLKMQRAKRPELGWFDTFFGNMATKLLKEYLSTRHNLKPTDRIFPCTSRNVNYFLTRMSTDAGLDWKVSSHSLRRFFNTNLKLAGVNESLVEYWMGHSLGRVRNAYLVPPVEEQVKLYRKAQDMLEPELKD